MVKSSTAMRRQDALCVSPTPGMRPILGVHPANRRLKKSVRLLKKVQMQGGARRVE